ncbi:Do family serine endopeptidase [bacterium endosymbiont of Pedicinus badii]|uniref:Do family serine endopeptidase n=1 Tax=bacterium endosymbiont of Pedicinus badii TaxID=1719126 RepID=UPI0009BA3A50|nr:Do family serine endopeptidase [bacterium endosymbiont of Pedicinus badii]OQM34150.1 serine endoprotease DegQ [bacterium endosymbiont of Pedicinus badii]
MKKILILLTLITKITFSFPFTSNSSIPIVKNISEEKIEQFTLAPMLERVLPTVVNIHVEGTQLLKKNPIPKEFRYFFGPDIPGNGTKQFEGIGSGVIIDSNKGYIITNYHVVKGADKIKVQLYDGREFSVQLNGFDELTDLAILKLSDVKNLIEIKMSDSDLIKVGDFVIAIGNPFGLGQTATSGIISGLGRSGLNVEGLENFIQTDASINRGNSGGALVNLKGELVGINTAILAPSEGNIGIGFAIPSNIVKHLSQQLITYGKVKRGQLGIKGTELNADIAKAFNIDIQKGAFVNEVMPKSAAEKSGIKAGDIIVSVEDKKINSFSELRAKISIAFPGKTVKLGVLRNGKLHTIYAILDDDSKNSLIKEVFNPALQGAIFKNFQLTDGTRGVMVEEILKHSPAYSIGLRKGDVIIRINREKIENIEQLKKALKEKLSVIALNIIRGNASIFLLIK